MPCCYQYDIGALRSGLERNSDQKSCAKRPIFVHVALGVGGVKKHNRLLNRLRVDIDCSVCWQADAKNRRQQCAENQNRLSHLLVPEGAAPLPRPKIKLRTLQTPATKYAQGVPNFPCKPIGHAAYRRFLSTAPSLEKSLAAASVLSKYGRAHRACARATVKMVNEGFGPLQIFQLGCSTRARPPACPAYPGGPSASYQAAKF